MAAHASAVTVNSLFLFGFMSISLRLLRAGNWSYLAETVTKKEARVKWNRPRSMAVANSNRTNECVKGAVQKVLGAVSV